MIHRRHFLWSSILLIGVIALVGCGSSSSDETPAPAPTVIGTLDSAILNAGGYYYQVHTQLNPGGELRTNITVPAGSTGTVTFNTTLTAAPGVTNAGTGTATLTVNVGTGEVTGASVSVSNLSSPIGAGAHIHAPAPAGAANGPIVIDLSSRVTVAAPTVIGTLDPAILNAGGYYFQVHTQTNGGGELRTNITVPAGSTGTVTFNTTLTAAPGVITAGTGTASLTVNVGTGAVTGASITVSNLSSPIAGAHIHNPAPAGQANGAIVIDLSTRVTVN
jgi:hypothetical protein